MLRKAGARSTGAASLPAVAALTLAAGARPGTGASLRALEQGLRDAVNRNPMGAAVATVLGGAYLLWLAEREVNPRCRTYWDALVFASTCLEVGHAQGLPCTPQGKAIASALMTFGPALAIRIFDPPVPPQRAA